jgi:RNA polymerase sigma factor (sigma-70 family)
MSKTQKEYQVVARARHLEKMDNDPEYRAWFKDRQRSYRERITLEAKARKQAQTHESQQRQRQREAADPAYRALMLEKRRGYLAKHRSRRRELEATDPVLMARKRELNLRRYRRRRDRLKDVDPAKLAIMKEKKRLYSASRYQKIREAKRLYSASRYQKIRKARIAKFGVIKPSVILTEFDNPICRYCVKANISLPKLGILSGLSTKSLYNFVRGKRPMTENSKAKLQVGFHRVGIYPDAQDLWPDQEYGSEFGRRVSLRKVGPDLRSPDLEFDKKVVLDLIDQALERLIPVQRNALILLYFEGKNLEEAGQVLGCCRENVRQLEQKALRHLRKMAAVRRLDGVVTY